MQSTHAEISAWVLSAVSKKSQIFLTPLQIRHIFMKIYFHKNLAVLVKKSVPDIFDGYNPT